MTCDDAFDLLTTSGGRADARLAMHLDGCPRCRAMSEALAPAIDLFDACAPVANAQSESSVAVARSSAARLRRRASRDHARGWRSRPVLGLALAGFAGAACCFLAVQIVGRDDGASRASCPRHSTASTEWMSRNSVPVAMACIACHPPAGALDTVSGIRPGSGAGTLQ